MIVLALDTCLPACSVALARDGEILGWLSEPTLRGHQERIAPMTRDLMAAAGLEFAALDRIGVTVGPGSFTGLRVGLAFAKGLAFALQRPCVGVGTLEALAASLEGNGPRAAVIDAGRGRVYMQLFDGAVPLSGPDILPLETAAARLIELYASAEVILTGPGAALLAGTLPGANARPLPAPDPRAVARLAAIAPLAPPAPLPAAPRRHGQGRVITVAVATAEIAPALAALHREAFDEPWSAHEIATLMGSPGVFALSAALGPTPEAGKAAGFILCRVAADEAEVLTLAVAPAMRRRGVAGALLDQAMAAALASGARAVFLEVGTDNPGAETLYRARGFAEVGRRPGYFMRPGGAVAALIMRRDLNR